MKFLVTKSFLAVLLTRRTCALAAAADDDDDEKKRDHLVVGYAASLVKRKEEVVVRQHAVNEVVVLTTTAATATNERIQDKNKGRRTKEDRQRVAITGTRDKTTSYHQRFNEKARSTKPDLDVGILDENYGGNNDNTHHRGQQQERRKIRGYRKEQLVDLNSSKKPVGEPSSEPSTKNEEEPSPSFESSASESFSPSALDESSFPSVSLDESPFVLLDESSIPSLEESLVPDDESLFPSSEDLSARAVDDADTTSFPTVSGESVVPSISPPSEEALDDSDGESSSLTPTLGPSESFTPSSIQPSMLPSSAEEATLFTCTVPPLLCQDFFQSRYPGFFVKLSELCNDNVIDDSQQVVTSSSSASLTMYYNSEECAYYRSMSCPSCQMICQGDYIISNIPIVACCAEACIESCGYESCNLV
jgi:hypothetical protein